MVLLALRVSDAGTPLVPALQAPKMVREKIGVLYPAFSEFHITSEF